MSSLYLAEDILKKVEKPARYIGHEVNARIKDKTKVLIRYALCFPDVYEIGMSHLGSSILYDLYNKREDVWCERVFSPWFDLDGLLRELSIPLFGLESQEKITNFDFLGFTIQYELCYTNILQVLDLSFIPLRSRDRDDSYPIVIGGGPCVYNPEPIADFFDVFFVGEGELGYNEMFDLYLECKKNYEKFLELRSQPIMEQEKQSLILDESILNEISSVYDSSKPNNFRRYFLTSLAKLEGFYVPSLYDVTYDSTGVIQSVTSNHPNAKKSIKKQVVKNLDDVPYPSSPVVPYIKATQDRIVLEIQRGCIRGCRFCQAGMVYRPTRPRSLQNLKENLKLLLANTGYDEISLSSLSSSDYLQLEELITFLVEEYKGQSINITMPSLRIDAFSLGIMGKVQDVRKSSLTFAPEAGSQRLRDVINKGLTEEMILDGARQAFSGGWTKVKLYFMLGLPTETKEDREAIASLADEITRVYYTIPKEQRVGRCAITISASFFIPKPFTPFQWEPMYDRDSYIEKAMQVKQALREKLNQKSIKFQWHEADATVIEGALARGDRRLSYVIEKAYSLGAKYDAWSESFSYDTWIQAFETTQLPDGLPRISLDFYNRKRSTTEILPWDKIDIGVSKNYLLKEKEKAKSGIVTPNCRETCEGCGAAIFEGGVCFES